MSEWANDRTKSTKRANEREIQASNIQVFAHSLALSSAISKILRFQWTSVALQEQTDWEIAIENEKAKAKPLQDSIKKHFALKIIYFESLFKLSINKSSH